MFGAYTPLRYFFLALGLVAFIVEAWAFIDAISRPTQAFVATGKQTKQLWLIILGVAAVVGLAGAAYGVGPDLDPAGRGVRRGRHLPGRRPSQGEGLPQKRRNQLGSVRPLVTAGGPPTQNGPGVRSQRGRRVQNGPGVRSQRGRRVQNGPWQASSGRRDHDQMMSSVIADVNIKAKVAELQAEVAGKLGITAERVLNELARLAFNDPRKFFDEDGRIKPVKELDDDTAMSLAGIETFHKIIGDEKDGMAVVTKVRISDKRSSLELLGRHLKLFTDKLEVNDTDALAAKLKAARTRKVKE